MEEESVRLMLWDTAGQEEFDSITKAYYRGKHFLVAMETHLLCAGAQVCVLAFSTVDRESFDAIERWKSKVRHILQNLMIENDNR